MKKQITARAENFSEWYLDVIAAADLADYASVKGCMVFKPNGYAIWELTQKMLDDEFKKIGVENAYFPLLIPEKLLKKEAKHVEGFAPEVAVVTHAGGKKLEEPLVIRPTSETVIYDLYSKWIQSYRDLPLLINQWGNVLRWELRTKFFLRTAEFLWQEGHTVHADEAGGDGMARTILGIYQDFAENYAAVPVIPGMKTEAEKFAGALKTYTLEAMMQDGKALQYATSHNLGQNFSKAFDISFLDEAGERKFGWQTSWGLSTRTIGGLIMTHGDDKGLVLPPKVAPTQAVVMTIAASDEDKKLVEGKAAELAQKLRDLGVRTKVDARDLRPGEKHFDWEKKGIPVRIELGPKDVANSSAVLVRRDTGVKTAVSLDSAATTVSALLETIQKDLYQRALDFRLSRTKEVDDWDSFKAEIENGNFVLAHWCGETAVEKAIQEETGATIRCIPFGRKEETGQCIKSGKPSKGRVVFAKAY